MPSTLKPKTARAAAFLFMATSVNALLPATYQGCYSVSTPLKEQGTWTYQTSGYCQNQCAPLNQAALGLSNSNECWCGNELPPLSAKVDDSNCNTPCDGYDSDMCGGRGYWSVYTTGLIANVPHYQEKSGGSSSSPSRSVSSSASPTPSVVTKVSPGTTVVVTKQPTATATASPPQHQPSTGGVNTAAVAAGVVVAVVVVTGAIAGVFIWLRYRRRREAEEEYKRAQVAELARAAERKPPPTSWSNLSDSRLEPAFHDRRNSHGSIADNEDYSRKILRVANPDRSSAFNPDRTSILPPDRTAAWPPRRL